ncbi:hypothetical protein L7F22_067532, partial [Adiantum nelumboides]|nr:hypothetical protein [Adiantum nelumboides]
SARGRAQQVQQGCAAQLLGRDGSVAVYDIEHVSSFKQSTQTSKHEALLMVDKGVGHQYSVSCVHWYPIDTGLFVTGSFDNYVNVWDTNTAQVEVQFNMSRKVYAVSMSNLSTTHMLIATGTEDTKIRQCVGCAVVTKSEWVLVSGGCDGAIRFWDIRRAGCYQVLDQQCSQIGRRPPVLKGISRDIGRVEYVFYLDLCLFFYFRLLMTRNLLLLGKFWYLLGLLTASLHSKAVQGLYLVDGCNDFMQ